MSRTPNPQLLEGTWAVDMGRISLDGRPYPFTISLDLVAAITLLLNFIIMLPHELTGAIYDYLGAIITEEMEGGVIDCEMIQTLPELTLVLGGQAIVLSWRDYTRVWVSGEERVCVVAIDRQDSDIRSAVIGLWLLQRFDVEFDIDYNEIALIELGENTKVKCIA